MKVQVNRVELLTLLEKLKPAVPSRSTLPICTSVLLKAELFSRKLTVTANNLEFALVGECKAKVPDPGGMCVEYTKLLGFLKATKGELFTIEAKVQSEASRPSLSSAVFTSNGSSLTMKVDVPADFPPVPEVQGEKVLAYNLAEALGKVSYAIATEETRPVLCGVCFRPEEKVVKLAASDGFRLAVTPLKVKGELVEMIIPKTVVCAIKKLMVGNVTVTQHKDKASFEQKGLKIVCSLVIGTFPKYEQLIPTKTDHAVTVGRDELLDAVKTALSIAGNDREPIVRLRTKGKNLLVSHIEGDDKCEAKIPARGTVKIALNSKYIHELLRQADETVTIRTSDGNSPLVVKIQGAIHLLMPVMCQWEDDKPKVEVASVEQF